MDILKHYISRADEIIGERTAEEQKYDCEVVRWLRRGKSISKAIGKANQLQFFGRWMKEPLSLYLSRPPYYLTFCP